jgi:hypothetical protein
VGGGKLHGPLIGSASTSKIRSPFGFGNESSEAFFRAFRASRSSLGVAHFIRAKLLSHVCLAWAMYVRVWVGADSSPSARRKR